VKAAGEVTGESSASREDATTKFAGTVQDACCQLGSFHVIRFGLAMCALLNLCLAWCMHGCLLNAIRSCCCPGCACLMQVEVDKPLGLKLKESTARGRPGGGGEPLVRCLMQAVGAARLPVADASGQLMTPLGFLGLASH